MSRVTLAHVEARRSSILEAAHKVFARKGMQAATMAEIAEEAGVSAGAIYRYYENKDALANACFRETGEQIAAEWRQLGETIQDPMEVFHEISRQSFEEINQPDARDHTRLMLEHLLDATRCSDDDALAAARDQRESIVRGLQEALDHARAAGQLPPGLCTYDLAQALMSFYMGARMSRLLDPNISSDAQLEQIRLLMELAGDRQVALVG